MNISLKNLFSEVAYEQPASDLQERILLVIEQEADLISRKRIIWARLGLLFSGVSLVVAAFVYGHDFFTSNFWSMITLVFSDARVVASYWSEFLFSLLEMFPIKAVVFLLAPSFATLLFLDMYFSALGARPFHRRTHFA